MRVANVAVVPTPEKRVSLPTPEVVRKAPAVSRDEVWDTIITGDVDQLKSFLTADSRVIGLIGAEGQTPLHLACDVSTDGSECVRLLVEHGADVHAQDACLRTPLLVACEVAALASARHLLLHTDASLHVADENGMTCAHWLASHGACELLAMVLQKSGEVDVMNSSHRTPLHLSISRGHLACALVLLDAGASPATLDDERRCAMHLAMQYSGGMGQCSESTLLLLRLLQLDPSLVCATDADKRTALHWACGKNALPCVRALLQSGSEVDAIDWAGRTPMHWAVLVDAAESLTELLTAGCDASVADRDQRTALHWAADRASDKCLKMLLPTSLGRDVDAVDWGGYSALHYAARRGAVSCVRMLLAHGASRRLVTMNGEQPLDLTSCDVTRALLKEKPEKLTGVGMKRQRSLSSSNSLVMLSVLPDLAKQFYCAWEQGDVSELVAGRLSQADTPEAQALTWLMAQESLRSLRVEEVHVSTKESKLVVELSAGAPQARTRVMHALTFTDDGLVSAITPYSPMQVPLAASKC